MNIYELTTRLGSNESTNEQKLIHLSDAEFKLSMRITPSRRGNDIICIHNIWVPIASVPRH